MNDKLDTGAISALISFFIPWLVAFLTKPGASAKTKALVNVVLSAIGAVVALYINPGDHALTATVVINTLLTSLVASFTAYQAIWKPTNVASTISESTANIGIGPTEDPYDAQHLGE